MTWTEGPYYQELPFQIYLQGTFYDRFYANGKENCVGELRGL